MLFYLKKLHYISIIIYITIIFIIKKYVLCMHTIHNSYFEKTLIVNYRIIMSIYKVFCLKKWYTFRQVSS